MDLEKKIAEEHSKALTMAIVKYIGNDKIKFKMLFSLFYNGEYKMSQRASWPLSCLAIEHPELIKPYIGKLIIKLQQTTNHPSIERQILKIFQEIEVPEKYEGYVVDCCFSILTSADKPIASTAFAITVAASICKKYPELKNELRLHLEHLQNYPASPAIKFRLKKALKEL